MIPYRARPLDVQFTRLKYLQSTGTQYINTGIAPDFAGGDSIYIHYYGGSYSGAAPCSFGSRESGVRNGIYLLGVNNMTVADNNGYNTVVISEQAPADLSMTVDDSVIIADDKEYAMPLRVTCGLPIFLFALNNYGTGVFGIYSGMKLYEWKYWRNGTLAQHLIPVLDRHGQACMFDTVESRFYYRPAGTQPFKYALATTSPVQSSVRITRHQPLTLRAKQANSTVTLNAVGDPVTSGLYYRTHISQDWTQYTPGTTVTLSNVNDYVQFYNKVNALSQSEQDYVQFQMTGIIYASGNIQALLNYSDVCPSYCFYKLFYACASLVHAPNMPAKYINSHCFQLIYARSGLVQAPALPARKLADYCYKEMFSGCSALIYASELPARVLAIYCYYGMFNNCRALVAAPDLPATVPTQSCYQAMFYGCSSLVKGPDIALTTLGAKNCSWMFSYDNKLQRVKVAFTNWGVATSTLNWMYGVQTAGAFIKPEALPVVRGISGIPENWLIYDKPLTLTAQQANSTVKLAATGTPTTSGLKYRTADTDPWTAYTIDTVITLAQVGDYVQFMNTQNTLSTGTTNYVKFVMSGKIAASGFIQSMLNYSPACASSCFNNLFASCTALTQAPNMLCRQLAFVCYYMMFFGCTNLLQAPQLPVTNLVTGCYQVMFQNCTSLVKAPKLPATTVVSTCYTSMFSGCSNLVQAPELPATVILSYCYAGMFSYCSKLNYIKVGFTDWNTSSNATLNWVLGINTAGTFIKPAALPETRGASGIPDTWAAIVPDTNGEYPLTFAAAQANSTVKLTATGSPTVSGIQYRTDSDSTWYSYTMSDSITLASTTDWVQFKNSQSTLSLDASNYVQFVMTGKIAAYGNTQSMLNYSDTCSAYCYYRLFNMCASLTRTPELPATTLANNCYNQMFMRCTNILTTPELPALQLAAGCYQSMFQSCSSLIKSSQLPALTLVDYCYTGMFDSCVSLTQTPEINATTTALYSCRSMFSWCTSLTQAPKLLAKNLAYGGYQQMFYQCAKITKVEIQAQTLSGNSMYRMFYNCTGLSDVSVKFTDWESSTNNTYQWMYGVAAQGTFTKPQSLPQTRGTSNIPQNWTVIDQE